MQISSPIGIDLGTTNTVVSVFRRGAVETIPIDGKPTLPSVVSFLADGKTLVGRPAKARLLIAPEETVASVKRSMGDRTVRFDIHGRSYTPIDISAIILRKAVEAASSYLDEQVARAVITVPAYFTPDQHEDTLKAGQLAGIEVLRLVPEPTAAAIAYGFKLEKHQTLMVYDLGGGTFDVSILAVNGNDFTTKAVGGDAHLGGDDFDNKLREWAHQRFLEDNDIEPADYSDSDWKRARQRLKEAAEDAKCQLAQSREATIAVSDYVGGKPLEYVISRDEYNRLIGDYVDKTITCIRSTLSDAKMAAGDIDRVILVGGSTRNVLVRELVTREIKEPFVADRVDEMVALGAALVAGSLDAPTDHPADQATGNIVFSDVMAHSVGISLLTEDRSRFEYCPLIERQTKYPVRRSVLAMTSRKMQTEVTIRVFLGEDTDPDKNMYLGELNMAVTPQFNFVFIAAVFFLNENKIIEFTAAEIPSTVSTEPYLRYAADNNGMVDLDALDRLIASGTTKPVVVKIKMT